MPTIEELVQKAADKGLTHLTMWPTHSADRKKVYWYARATPSTAHSYVQAYSEDPAEALKQVLESLPKAPKRAKSERVTFTVTDDEPKFAALEQEDLKPKKKGGLNPEWGI